ncbi:MAG: hypothetical protein IT469_00930 [Pseudomonadales bacterium]|nr:hypothetical protein [Pseudomonadales bacterium]
MARLMVGPGRPGDSTNSRGGSRAAMRVAHSLVCPLGRPGLHCAARSAGAPHRDVFQRAARMIAALILVMAPLLGFAHGGVSMEEDLCVIQIGRYKAHFTGYLPERRATQEFCEDIPSTGSAVFVIDFISDELREMELDFRIIRDVNDIGIKATYEDLGGEQAIEDATIFYAPMHHYPNGVMNVQYPFVAEGGYVGIINARHLATGLAYRSVFPFRVGRVPYLKYAFYFLTVIAACGSFVWIAGRRTFFQPA